MKHCDGDPHSMVYKPPVIGTSTLHSGGTDTQTDGSPHITQANDGLWQSQLISITMATVAAALTPPCYQPVCVCVCSALPLCCSNTDEELNSITDRMQPLEKSLWCPRHDVASAPDSDTDRAQRLKLLAWETDKEKESGRRGTAEREKRLGRERQVSQTREHQFLEAAGGGRWRGCSV